MFSRRSFLGTATALASASAVSGRVQAANIPEAPIMEKATMQPPLHPTSGPDYNPVVTLNGWTLPWRMNGDWKEFHLVAEPVVREFAEGMKAYLWGYNGQAPGSDHRSGRRRQGPHLRHQQAAGAHHGALARHDRAERHGRRRRSQSAAHQARQDVRLRVRAEAQRHLHVPPAFGRNGADGDGHDGHVRRASARSRIPAGRPRLRLHHEHLPDRSRHLSAEGQRDDRLQHVDLEQPRVPRDRSAARPSRRSRSRPDRQPHDDQPSDPSARAHLPCPAPTADGSRKARSGPRSPPMSRSVPSGHSTLSPTIPAIGRSIATRRTTP